MIRYSEKKCLSRLEIHGKPPRKALDLSFSIIAMGLGRSIKFEKTLRRHVGMKYNAVFIQ